MVTEARNITKYNYAPRKRAVLTARRLSGNVTLAAEHAKVSRSWLERHRKLDPAFEAACLSMEVTEFDADAPIPRMAASNAIMLLKHHKDSVRGGGKRRPANYRPPPIEEVRASIARKLEAIARVREQTEAAVSADGPPVRL